jgi:hypothetical protein
MTEPTEREREIFMLRTETRSALHHIFELLHKQEDIGEAMNKFNMKLQALAKAEAARYVETFVAKWPR